MMPVVLPAEGDATVIGHLDEPRVRDGDPVGVAAEIGQHLLRPAEGRLGIDDPFNPAELAQPAGEGGGLFKAGETAEEPEFAGVEGGLQLDVVREICTGALSGKAARDRQEDC
jgi:hypothetical protein